ncbi:MAG: response regulator [Roseivirga sp.]|jgi:DNA-binding LytR/AlgR family response regulator|uniref:LytR/AlgR family response regulator transcription factor n=1 Tax=Roseivirga sp. TaxID=1964215 RepID=UPI001B25E249|nr:response regulator [Roseivirga sp.]MBO6497429.1 response regulator [Roseivirga sp.]
MSLTCLIIDDEPFARKLLLDFCSRVPNLEVKGDFSNGVEALQYLNTQAVDFIFLDIKMPGITGIEMLNSLRNAPKVVFTTAFSEYAIDGFELDAVDYLLKPFDFLRFLKSVNKVQAALQPKSIDLSQASESDFLFVKDGRELVKLKLNEILYVKGQKDYVMFMLRDKKVMSLMNMKDLEEELKGKQFVRIHQSFIINAQHIESISNDRVKVGEEFLPISQSYKLSFRSFIEKFQ